MTTKVSVPQSDIVSQLPWLRFHNGITHVHFTRFFSSTVPAITFNHTERVSASEAELFFNLPGHVLGAALDNGHVVFEIGTDERRVSHAAFTRRQQGRTFGRITPELAAQIGADVVIGARVRCPFCCAEECSH